MSKASFLIALEAELKQRFGATSLQAHKWAADEARLAKFMDSVRTTLSTHRNTVGIDGGAFCAAWQAIGGKGKPTYKALRALPEVA